jgi:hypothetical protein
MEEIKETLPAQIERPKAILMRPLVSPAELISYQDEMSKLITGALTEKVDYGTIPGTNKPSLYKAGAERIKQAFWVYPTYQVVDKEIDHDRAVGWEKKKKAGWDKEKSRWNWEIEKGTSIGFYSYTVKCSLINRATGETIGDGIGSCSTMESKYIDRPRDCENVVLKMAQKRAFVAVTLNVYGLSDRFTQDVEDLAPATHQEGQEATENGSFDDILIEFGKHKGKHLSECPRDYIHWLSDKATTPEIKQAAINFLKKPKDASPPPPKDAPAPTTPTAPQEAKPTLNDPRQRVVIEIQALMLDINPLMPADALKAVTGYEIIDEIPDDKLNSVKVQLMTRRDALKAEKGKGKK